MATATMGYMVPVEVHERQKAVNRDLAAGFSYEEAVRRNDPKPARVTEHKKRSAQFDSPSMSLADLFDNSKWETHMVATAPKRGGEVERRRYIGSGQAPSAATAAASSPAIIVGSDAPGGVDISDIRPRGANYPYASGDQWIGSDNVWRSPFGMSYPVEDASRHHMRYNPGGHGAPLKKSEWSLGTLYDDAGATQARRLAAKPDLTGIEPTPEDAGIIDSIADVITKAKDFGSNAVDTVGEYIPQSVKDVYDYVNNPPASTITPEAVEQREAQRNIGNVDTMVFDQIERAIMSEFEDPSQQGKWSKERAYYQQLLAEGMDKSTAAIMAAREFGHPTRKTRDERRREREAEKLKTLQFLKDSGQLQTAPNGTEYITIG